MCSPYQKMPASTCGVADFEGEDRLFRIRLRCGLVEDWIQSAVKEALNKALRGVVASRGLPLVPARRLEFEGGGVGVHLRVEFEEGLVYAPQLLGPQVLEVHGAEYLLLPGERERA